MYHLIVIGRRMLIEVPDDTPLLWAIRDFFGLTGTNSAAESVNAVPGFTHACSAAEIATVVG